MTVPPPTPNSPDRRPASKPDAEAGEDEGGGSRSERACGGVCHACEPTAAVSRACFRERVPHPRAVPIREGVPIRERVPIRQTSARRDGGWTPQSRREEAVSRCGRPQWAAGSVPLLHRPAAVGGKDGAVDVHAVVAQQEGDRRGEVLGGRDRRDRSTGTAADVLMPCSETVAGIGMPVATPPGATALTRMPCGPYMNAALRVRPTTPCLDTV